MKNRLRIITGRAIVLLLTLTSLLQHSQAQSLIIDNGRFRVETGINFGPSFFLGDLGGNIGKGTRFVKDLNFELTKLMKGAFITVYPNEWVGLRLSANYTYLEGTDNIINTKGVDELWRKQRNLDFRSNVWELQLGAEVYPLMFFKRNDEDYQPRLRPYGFIGGGIFKFNPQGSITDVNGKVTWHDLHPLRTEGQGMKEYPTKKEYSLTQFNIPMGLGMKYFLSDRVNFSTEFLYRKSFTDYIDDVSTTYIDPVYFANYMSASQAATARQIHDKTIGIVLPGITRYQPGDQRGNPRNQDAYFTLVFKFGVKLGPIYESRFARNAARQTRCPALF
jgi:Outer membrane protein beta-barrel domain